MSKKFLISILCFATVGFMVTKSASAAITGSPHDFSGRTWNTSKEICIVCHTPHNALSTLIPLWNHATTVATFTLYSSPSLNATMAQPSGSSKACLSCHDGTVAIDSFGGATGSRKFPPGSRKNLGTDLSDDHPVSFTYDTTLATADGGLNDPATKTVTSLGGKTITAGMLVGGKLECSSCHDVHRDKGDSAAVNDLLLVNNTGSALCLTCHNK